MRLPQFRVVLRFSFYLLMIVGLFTAGTSDYRPSHVDRVIAPFKYSFMEWELGHISDKWIYRLKMAFLDTRQPIVGLPWWMFGNISN